MFVIIVMLMFEFSSGVLWLVIVCVLLLCSMICSDSDVWFLFVIFVF